MKKLTKEQKMTVHGGRSISGIIQGTSAIVYSISIIIGYLADYLLTHKEKTENVNNSKVFHNDIKPKTTIFS